MTAAPQTSGTPIVWQSRGDVRSLNLVWGIGSEQSVPKPPFTFEKEGLTGTNPKIKVIDADGFRRNVESDDDAEVNGFTARLRQKINELKAASHRSIGQMR